MRWILLASVLSSTRLLSQNMHVHFNDGTALSYNVNDVRSTGTAGSSYRLFLTNSTTIEWELNTITKYQFRQGPIGIDEVVPLPVNVHIHPNPSNGAVTIEFELDRAARLVADVVDLKRSPILRLFDGNAQPGVQRLQWDGLDPNGGPVPSGIYLLRLQWPSHVISRPIIIAR
jgi:hypothetical protein